MLEHLKQDVLEANQLLMKYNLVTFTFGHVSGIDRKEGLVVVKPSEVNSDRLTVEDLMVIDSTGQLLEGNYPIPPGTATHLELYHAFPFIKGITQTYSRWATIFAQMSLGIPPLGTLHADYFHGEIPCTRKLRAYEIKGNYEKETGVVIAERFKKGKLDPLEIPGILVCNQGPFTWGNSPLTAARNAAILEEIAFMAWHCMALPDKYLMPMQKELMERHFGSKPVSSDEVGNDGISETI